MCCVLCAAVQFLAQIISGMGAGRATLASASAPASASASGGDAGSPAGGEGEGEGEGEGKQGGGGLGVSGPLSELLRKVLLPLHLPNGFLEWRDQVPVIKVTPPVTHCYCYCYCYSYSYFYCYCYFYCYFSCYFSCYCCTATVALLHPQLTSVVCPCMIRCDVI
jgi:hypothetical protein